MASILQEHTSIAAHTHAHSIQLLWQHRCGICTWKGLSFSQETCTSFVQDLSTCSKTFYFRGASKFPISHLASLELNSQMYLFAPITTGSIFAKISLHFDVTLESFIESLRFCALWLSPRLNNSLWDPCTQGYCTCLWCFSAMKIHIF
jgi:hypothetical protein